VQAKRDTESSIFSKFWMPAFAGMTVLIALSAIMTQSRMPGNAGVQNMMKYRIPVPCPVNAGFTGMTSFLSFSCERG
jgi:hypothetical protein